MSNFTLSIQLNQKDFNTFHHSISCNHTFNLASFNVYNQALYQAITSSNLSLFIFKKINSPSKIQDLLNQSDMKIHKGSITLS